MYRLLSPLFLVVNCHPNKQVKESQQHLFFQSLLSSM
uniref:Uncharacterized protein n=1 Tax=Triticum urartu TaxID=4572 RepID=A0A8R7UVH7_TRIUA